MQKSIKDYFIGHGASRSLTRRCTADPGQGAAVDKKLLDQLFCLDNIKKFKKCGNRRCMTCPMADDLQIINSGNCPNFCKPQSGIVYLIRCTECNLTYIGQTGSDFNIRINGHRSAIKNFNKDSPINTGILDYEILHFQFHCFDKAKLIILYCESDLQKRLDLENYYICLTKSLFPYGLNSKLNGEGPVNADISCIYKKFMVIGRKYPNTKTFRGKRGNKKNGVADFKIDDFERKANLYISLLNINKIKSFIFHFKKSKLKWFVKNHLHKISFCSRLTEIIFLDLIKFRLNISTIEQVLNSTCQFDYCVVDFLDKDFECLKIPKTLHDLKYLLPTNNIKVSVAFRYCKPLRNLVCNYNYYSKNLKKIGSLDCHCNDYKDFIDTSFGHIVSGDLNIIRDPKLRFLLGLGSKFRCRKKVGLKTILNSINKNLDLCITKLARKYNTPLESFGEWKINIIERIKFNYHHFYFHNGDGFFLNKNILNEIKIIKDRFIVTVIDKAANNFGFMCKSFFKDLLLKEYGGNDTYSLFGSGKAELDKRILAINKRLKIKIDCLRYPYIFPTIKFHKVPVKFRFVTCSTNCYNKKMSKKFFEFLKIVLKNIKLKDKFFMINNNKNILEFLNSNSVFAVHTFDFENLFTSIPHNDLLQICSEIYNNYLDDVIICKDDWMDLCKFNIYENYVFNGLNFYKQQKGVPMGSSFSSIFADIYLHMYEKVYLNINEVQGFRFIDDLILFNVENFDFIFDIYPKELTLKKTNSLGQEANYLDLDIKISNHNTLIGLYDKRKVFNFGVKFLSHYHSNLLSKIFDNIFFSQKQRIDLICNNIENKKTAFEHFRNVLYDNCFPTKFIRSIDSYLKSFS